MSNKKTTTQKWVITVSNGACGTGAGGLQFANGKAECHDERIANWYKNRGYTVETPKVDTPAKESKPVGKKGDTPIPPQQPNEPNGTENQGDDKKESV